MKPCSLIFNKETADQFSTALLNWFAQNKRSLSFRMDKDPYKIWISEIMAQQTQIDTLLPYFDRFITHFPTVNALAEADEAAVLKLWEGLGYYSRARNLHKAAQLITQTDTFPNTYADLINLPGIGPYTGGAIASIAFDEKVPAVDGNVLRVVSRFNNYFGDLAAPQTKKDITSWVMQALPEKSGDFNEALMELGALICTPKNFKCLVCPVQAHCAAFAAGTTAQLPVKTKKIRQKRMQMEVILLQSGNSLLFQKRPKKGLLSTLWGFPIVEQTEKPGLAATQFVIEHYPYASKGTLIGHKRHVFTHIVWEMAIWRYTLPSLTDPSSKQAVFDDLSFYDKESWEKLALPIAFSKLLPLLEKGS